MEVVTYSESECTCPAKESRRGHRSCPCEWRSMQSLGMFQYGLFVCSLHVTRSEPRT